MAKYVALKDRRLEGGVPGRPSLAIVNTDGNQSLTAAFRAISAAGGRGKVDTLFVLCHGYAGQNERGSVSADAGGEGLQLGKEGLMHTNVHLWGAIKNKVKNIVIYSCAAADTSPGNEGTSADGRYLMRALALATKSVVYAADRIQWYTTRNGAARGAYEWGDWEGSLSAFYPDGYSTELVPRAPTEFADVIGGR